MKIEINKTDKILIVILILLYIFGYLIGSWNIFFNLFILFFILNTFKKSYDNKKFATKYLIFLIIFISLNILIKLGYIYNLVQNYLIRNRYNKTTINKNLQISPTPTIYQCPVINQKTQEDIDRENSEKNLSSYSYEENYPPYQKGEKPTKKIITVKYLEKIPLTCQYYDENYCQLKNGDKWTIKYPKSWQLYRIKKQIFDNYYNENDNESKPLTFYDLKFEKDSSYFYLEEGITLGGQPIIIKNYEWNYLKKYCDFNFYFFI